MIRVFPRRTKWTPDDDLAFVGNVPLFKPKEDIVRISVTFTEDIPEGEILLKTWSQHYKDVRMGGPALDNPGAQFTPGMFIKKGVVITSRGCIRLCPWCHVPKREGLIREYKISEGNIIQDNNLLACSESHIQKVFEMLSHQSQGAIFSGGLDARLLQNWHIDLLNQISIKEMWFACDSIEALDDLYRISFLLKYFPAYKKRCYVLMGFKNEPIEAAQRRIESVYDMGFHPFAQFYQGPSAQEKTAEWSKLIKLWSRPAAFKAYMKKEHR